MMQWELKASNRTQAEGYQPTNPVGYSPPHTDTVHHTRTLPALYQAKANRTISPSHQPIDAVGLSERVTSTRLARPSFGADHLHLSELVRRGSSGPDQGGRCCPARIDRSGATKPNQERTERLVIIRTCRGSSGMDGATQAGADRRATARPYPIIWRRPTRHGAHPLFINCSYLPH